MLLTTTEFDRISIDNVVFTLKPSIFVKRPHFRPNPSQYLAPNSLPVCYEQPVQIFFALWTDNPELVNGADYKLSAHVLTVNYGNIKPRNEIFLSYIFQNHWSDKLSMSLSQTWFGRLYFHFIACKNENRWSLKSDHWKKEKYWVFKIEVFRVKCKNFEHYFCQI